MTLSESFHQGLSGGVDHDPDRARAWFEQQGRPPITREHLRAPSELTKALPLFCEADPDVRITAGKTWIAHHHWVLGEISENFTDGEGRRELGINAIRRLLTEPATVTTRGLGAALRVLTY